MRWLDQALALQATIRSNEAAPPEAAELAAAAVHHFTQAKEARAMRHSTKGSARAHGSWTRVAEKSHRSGLLAVKKLTALMKS